MAGGRANHAEGDEMTERQITQASAILFLCLVAFALRELM